MNIFGGIKKAFFLLSAVIVLCSLLSSLHLGFTENLFPTDKTHQILSAPTVRFLIGISAKEGDDEISLKGQIGTQVGVSDRNICHLLDFIGGDVEIDNCFVVFAFLATSDNILNNNSFVSQDIGTLFDTNVADSKNQWLRWVTRRFSVTMVELFDVVVISTMDSLSPRNLFWTSKEIIKHDRRSVYGVSDRLIERKGCSSSSCVEFGFLFLSPNLLKAMETFPFRVFFLEPKFSFSATVYRSILRYADMSGDALDLSTVSNEREWDVIMASWQEGFGGESRLEKGVNKAVFINGWPHAPHFLWAYSFSRHILHKLSKSQENNTVTVLAHQARTKKYWQVMSPSNKILFQNPGADLKMLEIDQSRELLSEMNIVFARSISVDDLVFRIPDLFRFCESANRITGNNSEMHCPVIVSFPTGTAHCVDCSSDWYLQVPDEKHVKALSVDHYRLVTKIVNFVRSSVSLPTNVPKYLHDLFEPDGWKTIISSNCTVAYVAAWIEHKGQWRVAEELLKYSENSDVDPITICFAGGVGKMYLNEQERILSIINGHGNSLSGVALGELSFAEQVLLYAITKKSILLTTKDQSPRVVSMSLASGARVLTTDAAHVPSSLVDNDCMVTIFDEHPNSLESRAKVLENFLFYRDRCVKGNVTFDKAEKSVREEVVYGPIIETAAKMWSRLNSGKNANCLKQFRSQCKSYHLLERARDKCRTGKFT